MKDTSPQMEALYRRRMMARSGEERMLWGFQMFDFARALMSADLEARGFVRDSAEWRVQVFLRTYGNDFSEPRRSRIIARIRATASQGAVPSTAPGK